ncbi:F-actin capping protein [Protomyces lactucae-debilis]|uniref:F-actin-capping protein subunit beta n=1 Tax=Protomyces lactucae-debilis TaxID=2754530 RepID=A0A1Y2F2V1_PROLT|nr:F-actin capping protein [Protomyces lactucae-debilis]ORY78220.1 F-actin capping protein [Protomyces lactucae-debilis]
MADPLDAALDLLRRLKPQDIASNLKTLCETCPEIAEDLLGTVDQPLLIKTCKQTAKDFLACDFNREEDSYRSPWSNQLDPPIQDASVPAAGLRQLEVALNEAFDVYRDLYYEGGLSSVYLWQPEEGALAGAILLKKQAPGQYSKGSWDAIHVFAAFEQGGGGKHGSMRYELTSTVMLDMTMTNDALDSMNLGGNMTRQHQQTCSFSDAASHVGNLGRLVEEMEIKMRNLLQEVYFGKTKQICHELRSLQPLAQARAEKEKQGNLMKQVPAKDAGQAIS